VNPGVGRKFGVKSCGHGSSLLYHDGIAAFGGQDFNAFSDVDDLGGADENHFERRFAESSLMRITGPIAGEELAFANGAVDLAPVGVAADADVERADASLGRVFNFGGKKNCAGAGTEGGLHFDELFELLKSGVAEELEEGAGLASGDDEAVDVVKLLGLFDEHNFGAQLFKPAAVSVEIALQGQDTDGHCLNQNTEDAEGAEGVKIFLVRQRREFILIDELSWMNRESSKGEGRSSFLSAKNGPHRRVRPFLPWFEVVVVSLGYDLAVAEFLGRGTLGIQVRDIRPPRPQPYFSQRTREMGHPALPP